MKDTTEMAASQREDSEKGVAGKQSAVPQQQHVPVQQGTPSGSAATTRPEQSSLRRWEPFSPFDEMQQDMAPSGIS